MNNNPVMYRCPWCGTVHPTFQSNCKNCGGPLPEPAMAPAAPVGAGEPTEPIEATGQIPMPPPAPRAIADSYITRLMFDDGWSMAAGIFGLVGVIFLFVGFVLTIGVVTAFVGVPFALLGLVMAGVAGGVLNWRYQEARKTVNMLRVGEAVQGEILDVTQNYAVRVNRQHPWVIRYTFQVQGRAYTGQVSTLHALGPSLRAGAPICVLYQPKNPLQNTLYPHP